MFKKLEEAIVIAEAPLEQLEENLRKEYHPDIVQARNETKDKVTKALERGNFREAAVEKKAQALWKIMGTKNVEAVMSQQQQALAVLWKVLGKKRAAPLEIVEILNTFIHGIHIDICKKGYSFPKLVQQYDIDPYVQTAVYLRATEIPDLKKILETIADEVTQKKYPTTEMFVATTMERLAIMYAAENVKQNVVFMSNPEKWEA